MTVLLPGLWMTRGATVLPRGTKLLRGATLTHADIDQWILTRGGR